MKYTQVQLAAIFAGIASSQTLNIPTPAGSVISLPEPSVITGSIDLKNQEFDRGQPCDSDEDTGSENAVFILEDGASLSNVIIGADSLEGIHCKGACTLTNVWFRDVCEDAISILGTGDATITGGGAQEAKDKVVQHNGAGTVTIKDFTVVNAGKLYRSCGDCTNNEAKSPRHVVVENVRAFGMTSDLIGINPNFGDTASISGSCGTTKAVCREYKGVNKGEGDSEKLDTKGSCEGEQGKLEKLPECGDADETDGPVESAPEEEEPEEEEPEEEEPEEEEPEEEEPEEEEPEEAIPPIPTALVEAPVETSPTAPTTLLTKTKTIMPTATDAPSGSVAKWAQCGGIGYTGATSCSSGTCKAWNPYYSQCL